MAVSDQKSGLGRLVGLGEVLELGEIVLGDYVEGEVRRLDIILA
jgi:hypothetical protein